LAAPLAAAPGTRAVYSDVGFLVLGECLAAAGGAPLDALCAERVARPLALGAGFRRLSTVGAAVAGSEGSRRGPVERGGPTAAGAPAGREIAPTGGTRPREPAPGQEGLWSLPARPSAPGE